MQQGLFQIIQNESLTESVYHMTLQGDVSHITCPGQFINIRIKGLYLRRPLSVHDVGQNTVTVIYKVVGKGTEILSQMELGESLDLLTGLGNGYDTQVSGDQPLLIGGGVGVPPLYWLAKALVARGKNQRSF